MSEIKAGTNSKISLDRHILAITRPTIEVDPMEFRDATGEETNSGVKASRELGSWAPFIRINGYFIPYNSILSFNLDYAGFVPKISFSFRDSENLFDIDHFPRDGDTINIKITARQDTTFKDIRADFDISSISHNGAMGSAYGKQKIYYVSGILKIPKLTAEECISYPEDTSLNHLILAANRLKLGFATNVDSSSDKMTRISPYISNLSFIKDTINHSYIDDDSFQVGSIDPYYHLNFVNLNKVFNSPNEYEDTLTHLFGSDWNMTPKDENDINNLKTILLLSNHTSFGSSSQRITSHKVINNASDISLSMGYKRKLQFFENNSSEKLVSLDLYPMDSQKMADLEEPVRGRRDELDRHIHEVKQKYVGRIDAHPQHGNLHSQYYWASVSNKTNIAEINKIKLEVTLSTLNYAIYRYMKIPVVIFTANQNKAIAANMAKEVKKDMGFELVGAEYGEDKGGKQEFAIQNPQVVDEFLSGYYVIDEISYIYNPKADSPFYQKLTLLRREWPSRLNNINTETMGKNSTNTVL